MRPSERLTVLFLSALVVAALAAGVPGRALAFAALALATALLAGAEDGAAAAARDFFPVAVVVATFLLLEPAIAGLNGSRWDEALAAFDDRRLERLVDAWRGALGRPRWFTDLVYAAYASYYLLPIAAGTAARVRGPAAFERVVFAVLLAFYASFAGYFAFPASGPRLPLADEGRLLGGGAFSDGMRAFLRAAEQTRLDAFPSGHTAVSLVCAAVGARLFPRAAAPLAAWAAAIVFSTVYVHVHYAADVLAGAALAALVVAAAQPLASALGAATPSSSGAPRR